MLVEIWLRVLALIDEHELRKEVFVCEGCDVCVSGLPLSQSIYVASTGCPDTSRTGPCSVWGGVVPL